MYLLALACPPLAILRCGRWLQALFCVPLWLSLMGWPWAANWAALVVSYTRWRKRASLYVGADYASIVREVRRGVLRAESVEVAGDTADEVAELLRAISGLGLKAGVVRVVLLLPGTYRRVLAAGEEQREPWPRRTIRAARDAYAALPEWAQPITWGLAIGSPVSVIVAIAFFH